MSVASTPQDVEHAVRDGSSRSRQRAINDARQRLTSSSGTKASFDLELMIEYANARISSMWTIPVLVLVLSVFALSWVPLVGVVLWSVLVTLTHLFVAFVCYRFMKSEKHDFQAQTQTATFVFAETLYGFGWASLAIFPLLHSSQETLIVQWASLMVGMAVNAMSSRAIPAATLANTLPGIIAVSITLVSSGNLLSYELTLLAVGGGIFFNILARILHRSALKSIEHRAEKDILIFELEEAKAMSDSARRDAEQANVAKSRFLATMSHELRTPLNAVIGFSEVMKSELLGPLGNNQYKDYANDIHASGEHLLNLINELLDLSRIEAGKYDLTEEAVSLIDIGEDCRRMLQIRARAKSVILDVDFNPELPKVWCDERAVRQVCLNLLSNAVKFTPEGGKIIFRIDADIDGTQKISVRDSGPGIPEEEIKTVLSSFGQGAIAAKTAEKGAGLGLPIVQKIMELHQGHFRLFSKLRFGTEAIAVFPKSRVMQAVPRVIKRTSKMEIYNRSQQV